MDNTRNDDTRTLILETATDMFLTMEYSKVTLNEIARRVGVTKGGVYHYFDSKDDLLVASLTQVFEGAMEGSFKDISTSKSIYEVLEGWFDFASHLSSIVQDDSSDYNYMFQMIYLLMLAIRKRKGITKEIGALYDLGAKEMEALIAKAQDRGEIRDDLDPKAIALQLLAVVEGGMLVSVVREDDDLEGTGKLLLENIWKQIKA